MRVALSSINCIQILGVISLVFFIGALSQPVKAQHSPEIMKRLQRMQNDLTILQKYVYRGKALPAKKISRPPESKSLNTALARLSNTITQLDAEIRRLTGTNEELNYEISNLKKRLNTLDKDVALRLETLENRLDPAIKNGSLSSKSSQQSVNPKPLVRPSGPSIKGADKGVKPFGTKNSSSENVISVKETPKQQFEKAYSLIIKQNHEAAEQAFTAFIRAHPTHPFASNAFYWLGRTFFVRDNFEQAASTFAQGFQRFPNSKKAQATLLNLGMSLSKLGKDQEACMTYKKLRKTFKNLTSRVNRRLDREHKKSSCRR
ncbi:MAG: tol-pal system protein YbgF [Rhodospirillales bacterium]|nr:tol-pal system protein YbgF [Rhodospirillales bacterium]|tara:strand:+ start:1941 stop:2894 length:954 start_codon:yes stop_codon:yes gene_type:complete